MQSKKIAALFALASAPAMSQFSYPGCADLTANDFRHAELARGLGLQEPVGFDLQGIYNAAGDSVIQVNMFFVERASGNVKFFNGATNQMSTAGNIPVWGTQDNGLMGVVLDPDFNNNRFAYFWYSPPIANGNLNRRLRLSRITLNADNTLNMASLRIMIDILASKTDRWHSGGPMTFDAYGDLWVAVGNNSLDMNPAGDQFSPTDSNASGEWSSSNTASLRGGFFRIHPDNTTNVRTIPSGTYGNGYSIPAGNFGDYWATQFQNQGNATLAAQYRDPVKVLPEVYVKGERSNYSVGVHPVKRWLTWGTVNYQSGYDEINLAGHPIFTGSPYFMGNNVLTPTSTKNPASPTNTSPLNNGVTQLPPAIPGALNYASGNAKMGNVAIGGPVYVFNRALKNPGKLPPHLHNHVFHMSFELPGMWVNTVDSNALTVTQTTRVDNGIMRVPLRSPLAARIGPDGAFYLLNYDGFYSTNNPAVERMTYAGSCTPTPIAMPQPARPWSDYGVSVTRLGLTVRGGEHAFSLFHLDGRRIFAARGTGETRYSFSELRARYGLDAGVYMARVHTAYGLLTRQITLF